MGTLERQKKPSVTLSFNRLLPASVLSRQRSRVRAPSSPPYNSNRFKSLLKSDKVDLSSFITQISQSWIRNDFHRALSGNGAITFLSGL